MTNQFAEDIKAGLTASPKTLPSKYFYDEIGDKLFVQIMDMPEYYLTRAEMEIFTQQTQALITALGQSPNQPFEILDLGAGDGRKTIHLLKGLLDQDYDFTYRPVDISPHVLSELKNYLYSELNGLKIESIAADYFSQLSELCSTDKPQIILFLGSNLGNFNDDKAGKFLRQIAQSMKVGDRILLGLDRIKPEEIVLPAYNDAAGITAQFNLNLLRRINIALGANFNLDQFEHAPHYSQDTGIATSYIKSLRAQKVTLGALSLDIDLKAGEKIQTEISRKYDLSILSNMIMNSGLALETTLSDSQALFYDIIIARE